MLGTLCLPASGRLQREPTGPPQLAREQTNRQHVPGTKIWNCATLLTVLERKLSMSTASIFEPLGLSLVGNTPADMCKYQPKCAVPFHETCFLDQYERG